MKAQEDRKIDFDLNCLHEVTTILISFGKDFAASYEIKMRVGSSDESDPVPAGQFLINPGDTHTHPDGISEIRSWVQVPAPRNHHKLSSHIPGPRAAEERTGAIHFCGMLFQRRVVSSNRSHHVSESTASPQLGVKLKHFLIWKRKLSLSDL